MAINTKIGYATSRDIFVRGQNLSTEIIPSADFVDMAALCILGSRPNQQYKRMLNVLLVTACDHGFTPSSMSARLTYLGAPESMQGAVAAGLLGAGDRYLGVMQNVVEMLRDWAEGLAPDSPQEAFDTRVQDLIQEYRSSRRMLHGLGHPIHVDGDPRVPALRELSRECGYYGVGWRLLDALEVAYAAQKGKRLPVNGAGAMGAIAADLGLDPMVARGLALVGRAAGLVAHVYEESRNPSAPDIWKATLNAEEH